MLEEGTYKNVEYNVHSLSQDPDYYLRVNEILTSPTQIQNVNSPLT